MSSETEELANLVHEWLRIDKVSEDNVLTSCPNPKSRASRTLAPIKKLQIYGPPDRL